MLTFSLNANICKCGSDLQRIIYIGWITATANTVRGLQSAETVLYCANSFTNLVTIFDVKCTCASQRCALCFATAGRQ